MNEQVTRYLDLPYLTITRLEADGDGSPDYIAFHPGFGDDQCMAQGATEQEAVAELREVTALVIEHLLDSNLPIPAPLPNTGVWSVTNTVSAVEPNVAKMIVPAVRAFT